MEGKHDSVTAVKTFLCYHADINSETGWPATVRAKTRPHTKAAAAVARDDRFQRHDLGGHPARTRLRFGRTDRATVSYSRSSRASLRRSDHLAKSATAAELARAARGSRG